MKRYIPRKEMVLLQVSGEWLLVATGSALHSCPYVSRLDPISAEYWRLLSDGVAFEEIVQHCLNKYHVNEKVLRLALLMLTKKMLDAGMLFESESEGQVL